MKKSITSAAVIVRQLPASGVAAHGAGKTGQPGGAKTEQPALSGARCHTGLTRGALMALFCGTIVSN
jgi:hypothetical protein